MPRLSSNDLFITKGRRRERKWEKTKHAGYAIVAAEIRE